MNTIEILHRESKDTTQLKTPNLDFYHESMMPAFKNSFYKSSTGKEAFRLVDNTIHFHGDTTDQDVRAAMELLKKKGATEVMPQGESDFLISCHQAGYHQNIEVLHPDLYEAQEKVKIMDEVNARMLEPKQTKTKGMRIR